MNLSDLLSSSHLIIVLLLTVGFTLASILGYFAFRYKFSPILGYLLAGYLIGPFSPGIVADITVTEQLAEIGVMLMMFGIGLNFKIGELLSVKKIAIPGAILQTLIAGIFGATIVHLVGWKWSVSVILGLAIGVASTVVLVRMLSERHILKTREGHITVGWLIVEDLITVLILLLLPDFAKLVQGGGFSLSSLLLSIGGIALKFIVLVAILMTFGRRAVSYILTKVIHTHSHELFTIAVLALIFIVAMASAAVFGMSIALGAFIAGMVVGQTEVRDVALIHSLPLKDAFVAVFFLSVGMLFNPEVIINFFPLFLAILAVVVIIKPVTAFLITLIFRYPFQTAITVAAALAQIGEFSFILSEEASKHGLMSDDGYDLIVAVAIVSIVINPFIFKLVPPPKHLKKNP